jgi:RNA polymerase sigma-70 factor (ECF subfamily)
MIESEAFLQALRRGDQQAFAKLVEEHSPSVYQLALRMLHDPQEAEDVLQETFLNAFRALPRFEGRAALSTWLYRIATNQALMRLRRKRPQEVSLEEPWPSDDGDFPRQFVDWCCLPEKEFMTEEVRAELRRGVEGLSPALRSVFVLRDLHGLSTRETAEVLGISESAVKTRLLRARLQLREHLSDYFADRIKDGVNE